jgi:hypothetical protein
MTRTLTTLNLTEALSEPSSYLPELVNYQAALTTAAGFVGLWKFDDPAYLTLASSLVTVIANWKSGGPSMILHPTGGTVGVSLGFDSILQRNVGEFVSSAPNRYDLASSYVWNPLAAFSVLAVVNPTSYAVIQRIAGMQPDLNDIAGLRIATSLSSVPQYRGTLTNTGVQAGPTITANAGAYNRVLWSYEGDGSFTTSLSVNGGSLVTGTGTTTMNTGDPFSISGSSSIGFSGSLDLVALFSTNLNDVGNAATLALLNAYLTARGT